MMSVETDVKEDIVTEFTFLARCQHSFTGFFANCLFNNAVTNRAEDTDFVIFLTRGNTIRLRPDQGG